jgi:hypothetical protein
MGLGLVVGLAVLAGAAAVGCGSEGGGGGGEAELGRGTLRLPLLTEGASGTRYRLRNATFEVIAYNYYYYPYAGSAGGEGGSGSQNITVSSEDDPDATSIALSVERGDYYVRLLPGWHMEKLDAGGATEVEATLLSSDTQWVYVSAHSSSWVEYEFGLGERKLWFNGQLNIEIRIHEDPSEIYGSAGQPGVDGLAGAGAGGYSGAAW